MNDSAPGCTTVTLDTNQLYYIRKIAEQAEGWDYGDYQWAYRQFPGNPELIADIRALCYIVALQYEWELEFCTSDASFTELDQSRGRRAGETKDAWVLFVEGLDGDAHLRHVPWLPNKPVSGRLNFDFIADKADRVILRHFVSEQADVLLTSDDDILQHKSKLVDMGISVVRPSEWLNNFLADVRGEEDAVDWLERILFSVGDNA